MTDTEPYKQLINKDVALKDGSKVVGVPYAMETYGLIYNKDLLAKYIATDGAKIKDVKDIDNFDTLKAVADDIRPRRTSSESGAHSLPLVSIPAPIGASRPIWPTCRCTTSSRMITSPSSRRPSRVLICRSIRTSSTCTCRIPPPSRPS